MSNVTKPIILNETGEQIVQKLSEIASSNKSFELLLDTKADKTSVSTPYNFKGSTTYDALPTSNNNVNDTYYCTDVKCKYTWNGNGWYQSSMNESDYTDELSQLSEEIENGLLKSFNKALLFDDWEIGGVNGGNGVNVTLNYAIRTNFHYLTGLYKFFTFDKNIRCFNAICYDKNGVFMRAYNINNNETFEFIGGYKYKILVVYNSDYTITSVSDVLSTCSIFNLDYANRLENLENSNIDLTDSLNKVFSLNWEIGGIDASNGVNTSTNIAIRTTDYFNTEGVYLFNIIDDVLVRFIQVFVYDSNYKFLSKTDIYNGDTFNFADGNYYRLLLIYNSSYTVSTVDEALVTFSMISNNLEKRLTEIEKDVNNIILNNDAIANISNITLNVLGDSTSSVDYDSPNWWQCINERLGTSFNNYAVSGTRIATSSLSNSFCERYSTMKEADGVIVMGGRNDASNIPLGEWNSTDTSTIYGALNTLIVGLLKKYVGKPIIFCTPIQSAVEYSTNVIDALSSLKSLSATDKPNAQLLSEAIKVKCKQYSIPCVDLFNECGLNGVDDNRVYFRSGDILHQTSLGHERISYIIENKLKELYG